MYILILILGLLLIIGLVVVHEFGHFLVARHNNVEVEEFGIGFPPRAWHKKMKGGFDFSINWLPLGGFVRLKGAHDTDTDKNGFGKANLWVKTKIMLAGVAMNVLAAFVLLTILGWVGIPQLVNNQFTIKSDTKIITNETLVGSVEPNSPASSIGIKANDQLVSIGKVGGPYQNVNDADLPDITQHYAGQKVRVVYVNSGKTITATTTLRNNDTNGYLGVAEPFHYVVQRSTWSAPIMALGLIKQYTILTYQGLGSAVRGFGSTLAGLATQNEHAKQQGLVKAESQVSGPVGIYNFLKFSSSISFQFTLLIVAIISLTLALVNVLIIPALDGGRLFIIYVTRIIRKPLKPVTEDLINGAGFAVLMVLVLLITIVDVKRFY